MKRKIIKLYKTLGPGILFASTAIGVSHLVQSTRAGADYGYGLVWAVVLANIFKYPFFEFGSRYASATGKSLLSGYLKEGKWVLVLYFVLTISTMFTVISAVTFVTAGLMGYLFHISIATHWVAGIILLICIMILGVGNFSLLDHLLKIVASVLLFTTLIAFFAVLWQGSANTVVGFTPKSLTSYDSLVFVIALMGWMPTAVDLSSWNSIWTVEKMKQTGYKSSLKETLFDFNIGYLISAVLALCFLVLGAMTMYGTGVPFSSKAVVFSGQLINMYTHTVGAWVYYIIAIAALSTMFSTSITVLDGYSRVVNETIKILFSSSIGKYFAYYKVMIIVALLSFGVICLLSGSLKRLVDLATTLSFLIAPVIALLNYKVIISNQIKRQFAPKYWLKVLAVAGIVFLTLFTLFYIIIRFKIIEF